VTASIGLDVLAGAAVVMVVLAVAAATGTFLL
jgi:hypothetical protein